MTKISSLDYSYGVGCSAWKDKGLSSNEFLAGKKFRGSTNCKRCGVAMYSNANYCESCRKIVTKENEKIHTDVMRFHNSKKKLMKSSSVQKELNDKFLEKIETLTPEEFGRLSPNERKKYFGLS